MTVNTQEFREAAEAFKQACDDGLFDTEFGTWEALSYEFDQQVSHTVVLALLDDIDTLRAELQARQWQPIETAPHDQEVLLGWYEWDGAWKAEVGMASWGWRTDRVSNISLHGRATHWQTLPPAPPQGETA